MKAKQKPAKHNAAKFTKEELGAMKSRVKELKEAATKADDARAVLAAIAALQAPDRALAKRLHALITSSAPALSPKPWYGMPAYAKDGKIVCFFQPAQKFKTRYATLGFSDEAKLDEGNLWPNAYALTQLSPADEAKIAALVKKAAS
jgi:uncharacterized protein YdhG (YjbR/CyaY superfamily)